MNHKFKMRQRVTALCMAAMMCCGMLPYGALAEDSARPVVVATPEQAATQEAKSESDANSTATPETADESLDEDLYAVHLKPNCCVACFNCVRFTPSLPMCTTCPTSTISTSNP